MPLGQAGVSCWGCTSPPRHTPLNRQCACSSVRGTCGSAGQQEHGRGPAHRLRSQGGHCQHVPWLHTSPSQKVIPQLRQDELVPESPARARLAAATRCRAAQQPQPLLRALGWNFGFQIHVQRSISKSKHQSLLTPLVLKPLSIFACGAVFSLVTVPRNYGRLTFFKHIILRILMLA